MGDNIAAFVGNVPQHYDSGLGPVIFVDAAEDLARRVAAASPGRVLETAAGTGILTRRLRDALPSVVELTATDLNPPMLEIARAKFQPDEQVAFQSADAMQLPFADGSFDVVACQFGVMFFPDKDRAYREVLRVLSPGGRYLFNVWDSHRWNSFGRITHELVARFFPVDPPQFQKVPFSYAFEPAKASLVEAGFTDIEVSVVRRQKEIADVRGFARGLVYGSPLIDQVRVRGAVDPEAIVDAIVDEFGREFGTQSPRLPLQSLVFSADKPA